MNNEDAKIAEIMSIWNSTIFLIGLIYMAGHSLDSYKIVNASILNTILGVPNDCLHHGNIWPCKLSFSCWLQGGRHANGCGTNKWLFSCCVPSIGGSIGGGLNVNTASSIHMNSHSNSYSTSQSNINVNNYYDNHNNNYNHNYNNNDNNNIENNNNNNNNNVIQSSELLEAAFLEYKKKVTMLPKRVLLRRRNDNDVITKLECGLGRSLHNSLQKRIIGGRPAQFAEYPWQAHIRIAEYQCGGVLISSNMVATAAHCIQQAKMQDIAVYLGELDTQNLGHAQEPLPAEKHYVMQKIIHPRFELRMTQPDRYDLALLKLAKPTGFSEHILPICLPTHPIRLVGRKAIVAGWGKTEASLGQAGTNMLQVATVPIITSAECIRWHETKQIRVELFNEMFCAGHPDGRQDACLGDSGGPLIVKERGHYTLVGITSAGFGCGVDHQPGIYHNVQMTTKWIQEILLRNTF